MPMTAIEFPAHRVAKPWGRRTLPPCFADVAPDEPPVGEIWFKPPDAAPLMVKYLFTSETLSVQVHPGDAAARRRGHTRGKDEAWVILAADPGTTIALGPKAPTTRAALAAAVGDGSIDGLLDWRPVVAGDVIYVPAGTIHALGPGLTLVEMQQNIDLTYRLYDYGRPRELQLEDALEVVDLEPFRLVDTGYPVGAGRRVLARGKAFTIERLGGGSHGIDLVAPGAVFLSISGDGRIDGSPVSAGRCWALDGRVGIELEAGADALLAYPADAVAPG